MSLSWFGDDRRSILSILSGDFLLLRRFYVLFCLYVYVYLGVKEICSSYLDLLYYRQRGGARANSKVRNRLSQQFIFIDKFILFCKHCPFVILMRNKFSIRQGENRPKEPNCYSTMGISVTEASAAEINHDLLCAFIEVSAVYRFCSKPNLTVLKSCMMLSRSLIMVLCFGGDL